MKYHKYGSRNRCFRLCCVADLEQMIIAIVSVIVIVVAPVPLTTAIAIAIVSVTVISFIPFQTTEKGGKYETEICNKYLFFRCKASVR